MHLHKIVYCCSFDGICSGQILRNHWNSAGGSNWSSSSKIGLITFVSEATLLRFCVCSLSFLRSASRKEGVFRFPPTLTQIFTSLAGDQGFGTRKMSSEHVATFGIKLIGHCAHVQSFKNILVLYKIKNKTN